jgi:pimeloyl-ACP methyl ester carboxylesterase
VIGVSAGAPSSMQFALRHGRRSTALVLLVPMACVAGVPAGGAGVAVEQAIGSDFVSGCWRRGSAQEMMGTPAAIVSRADASEKARFARLALQPLPVSERERACFNDLTVVRTCSATISSTSALPTLVISARDDLWGTLCERGLHRAAHSRGALRRSRGRRPSCGSAASAR